MFEELKNPNVSLYLISLFFATAGGAVWGYTILTNLMYLITDSTLKIGIAEGIQGLISALLAVPFGILADRWAKHKVGKIGIVVQTLACICLIMVMSLNGVKGIPINYSNLYYFLTASLVLYGISNGIGYSALATLYTNSIQTGKRSEWMSYMQIVLLCGLCFGPLVTIIILQVNGDSWQITDMLLPWNITLGFTAIAGMLQMFMHDKWCLPNEEMGTIRAVLPDQKWNCLRTKHIPYLILCFDTISGIGSGMSIKFFPLFFQQEIGYSPTEVQIVYAVSFLVTAIATWFTIRLAKKIGRIQTTVIVPAIGLLFMVILIIGGSVGLWTPEFKWLIGGCFVIRTALMNAASSISKSVVDDYVSSEKRGCWNSLEFIFIVGWSGSAVLGGQLLQSLGYQNTYIITVIVQFVSVALYLVLIPLVPKKEYNLADTISGSETDSLIN